MNIDTAYRRAIKNICWDARRQILGHIDDGLRRNGLLVRQRRMAQGEFDRFKCEANLLKEDVHRAVFMMHQQMLAAYEILRNNGEIPPFGRSETVSLGVSQDNGAGDPDGQD